MTKEQLERWREMGFEFDEFYDSVAQDSKSVVTIKFVSSNFNEDFINVNLAFKIKKCKSKFATISVKLLPKPLSFLEFEQSKNIEFKGESHTFNFKIKIDAFNPEKFNGEDFIASITCDSIIAKSDVFKIAEIKKINEKNESISDCEDKFKKISAIILKHEGGYSDKSSDEGGKTNKGIAWQTWLAYSKKDLSLEPTVENLKNLTDEQAEYIYRKRYWEPKGFCLIENLKIALMYYDWTITSGGATSTFKKFLESEYDLEINSNKNVAEQMAELINSIKDQNKLLAELTDLRIEYYTKLAYKTNRDGSFKKDDNDNLIKVKNFENLQGWLNRVEDCKLVKI